MENFEPLQVTRYMPGEFFRPHNDAAPNHDKGGPGMRLYTMFVYMSDVEEGGGTHFTKLNITAPAKRGAAVFFPDTTDADPSAVEDRTEHEGMDVIRGEKVAINLWAHMYDYMYFYARNCPLGDSLVQQLEEEEQAKGLNSGQKKVEFQNPSSVQMQIYWVDGMDFEILVDLLPPEGTAARYTYEGHIFRIREGEGGNYGTLIREYKVGNRSFSRVLVGSRGRSRPEL
eukprot:gnl/TRDRNA2_/TRDRNA2_157291_c0_seq2.p1 gnl/TRDRNA2_/TRDRNA2_157291_c0~~gnl/TRDRNA2_/TRDRNA2_157291_c0_seq2.p1  ORF type:complete len:228 (+),score=33.10 gnl/TRDRNA2_/TRDRNA2_157291_c0_seq2:147-830(+)